MPATNKAIIELARQWDKAREQVALVDALKARATAAADPTPTDAPIDAPAESATDAPTK